MRCVKREYTTRNAHWRWRWSDAGSSADVDVSVFYGSENFSGEEGFTPLSFLAVPSHSTYTSKTCYVLKKNIVQYDRLLEFNITITNKIRITKYKLS